MNVNFKKLDSNAVIPTKAHTSDAGFDMVAISVKETDDYIEYGTGIALEIPENHVGLLFPRSSISKYDLSMCNSVGVIDANYRGEIKFRFKKILNTNKPYLKKYFTQIPWIFHVFGMEDCICDVNNEHSYNMYNVGDRIGQLIIIPYPEIKLVETKELSSSDRGEGGFGSTDSSVNIPKSKRNRKKKVE